MTVANGTASVFGGAMLTSWGIGRLSGRRFPPDAGHDPGMKFTEANMAILGLLLAFAFAMALSRHDDRRAGYNFTPLKGDWMFNQSTAACGPDIGITGPYARNS